MGIHAGLPRSCLLVALRRHFSLLISWRDRLIGFTSIFFHGETLILWEEGVAQLITIACWGLASHVSSLPGALPSPPAWCLLQKAPCRWPDHAALNTEAAVGCL